MGVISPVAQVSREMLQLSRSSPVAGIKAIQNLQGLLLIGARCQDREPEFRVVRRQGGGAELLDQLVDAHNPRCRQLFQSLAGVIGKPDRQGAHDSPSKHFAGVSASEPAEVKRASPDQMLIAQQSTRIVGLPRR